jgi:hypothetical protein
MFSAFWKFYAHKDLEIPPETEDSGNIFMLISIRNLLLSVRSLIGNEVSVSL